MPLRSGDFFL